MLNSAEHEILNAQKYKIIIKFSFFQAQVSLIIPGRVGRAPDSHVRGPGFDTRSGHILSFLLPLIQEGQLSVTGESMCTKH